MNALSRPNPVATVSVFLTHGWEARRRLAEKNERSARRWESGGKARQVPNAHYRLARIPTEDKGGQYINGMKFGMAI